MVQLFHTTLPFGSSCTMENITKLWNRRRYLNWLIIPRTLWLIINNVSLLHVYIHTSIHTNYKYICIRGREWNNTIRLLLKIATLAYLFKRAIWRVDPFMLRKYSFLLKKNKKLKLNYMHILFGMVSLKTCTNLFLLFEFFYILPFKLIHFKLSCFKNTHIYRYKNVTIPEPVDKLHMVFKSITRTDQ